MLKKACVRLLPAACRAANPGPFPPRMSNTDATLTLLCRCLWKPPSTGPSTATSFERHDARRRGSPAPRPVKRYPWSQPAGAGDPDSSLGEPTAMETAS
jgi:hypothetical protein